MSKKMKMRAGKSLKMFWFASFLATAALLVGAVMQINSYIHADSYARDCARKVALLTGENDSLAVNLSQSNSLERFREYATTQADNYEKVDVGTVHYVKVPGEQLAKK